tara:strand:- start:87 stop:1040 length:954 start_codon:yes stop_codon:yes gene_type:complete
MNLKYNVKYFDLIGGADNDNNSLDQKWEKCKKKLSFNITGNRIVFKYGFENKIYKFFEDLLDDYSDLIRLPACYSNIIKMPVDNIFSKEHEMDLKKIEDSVSEDVKKWKKINKSLKYFSKKSIQELKEFSTKLEYSDRQDYLNNVTILDTSNVDLFNKYMGSFNDINLISQHLSHLEDDKNDAIRSMAMAKNPNTYEVMAYNWKIATDKWNLLDKKVNEPDQLSDKGLIFILKKQIQNGYNYSNSEFVKYNSLDYINKHFIPKYDFGNEINKALILFVILNNKMIYVNEIISFSKSNLPIAQKIDVCHRSFKQQQKL